MHAFYFCLPSLVFPYSFSTFVNPQKHWFSLLDKEDYTLIRAGIRGSPSMLYTRYHERDVTFLHPHEFGKFALPCKMILG